MMLRGIGDAFAAAPARSPWAGGVMMPYGGMLQGIGGPFGSYQPGSPWAGGAMMPYGGMLQGIGGPFGSPASSPWNVLPGGTAVHDPGIYDPPYGGGVMMPYGGMLEGLGGPFGSYQPGSPWAGGVMMPYGGMLQGVGSTAPWEVLPGGTAVQSPGISDPAIGAYPQNPASSSTTTSSASTLGLPATVGGIDTSLLLVGAAVAFMVLRKK